MTEIPKPSGRIRPFAVEVRAESQTRLQLREAVAKLPPPQSTCGVMAPVRTLAEWRNFLGGDEGVLEDPWGEKHRVSLRAYTGRAADTPLLVGLREYLPREEPSLTIADGTVVGLAP